MNYAETQQYGRMPQGLDHKIKDGGSSAKDSVPERLRYGTIQKEVS